MLSYTPPSATADLTKAQERLTGSFKDSYAALVKDVVIPASQQKNIAAKARVAAAAVVSANRNEAKALVFVDQTITVGTDAPTDSTSSVRVTLERHADKWLISAFDPA
jgi:Mce-associated membrane protein